MYCVTNRKSAFFFIHAVLLFVIMSCSGTTEIAPTPTSSPATPTVSIDADNTILIRKLYFTGGLEARNHKLHEPFLGGFAQVGDEIKCLHKAEHSEGFLDVVIDTSFTSTRSTKAKYIPVVGGLMYAYGSGQLTYNWAGSVTYRFYDREENIVANDSFVIRTTDSMAPKAGMSGLGVSVLSGGGVMAAFYPDKNAHLTVGDEFLNMAGREIAKRLRIGTAAEYFVTLTKARDGMDSKTYAEFLAKKIRLKNDRATSSEDIDRKLVASVGAKDEFVKLGDSRVMVFGLGIDRYENYPDLKYAASDCLKVVNYFKTRYNLSDDWAMALTNEQASAIKVIRFLERNAAKLLNENDTFIFYFAGHGAPETDNASIDADGLAKYLLLANSEPDALALTGISLTDIADLLRKLPCKRVIVLIDSCFSGEAGRKSLDKLRGIKISRFSYDNFSLISGKGRVILAASSEDQVSQELDRLKAGVFTHFLVQGLNNEADRDGNQKVDILELYKFTRENVEKQTNGSQTPVLRGSLDQNIEF